MKHNLRRLRLIIALISISLITLLFLDFTWTIKPWGGWLAKIQLLPAILSLNILAIAIVLIITVIFGRIYCSVICPLGILQDFFGWLGKKHKKYHYSFSKAKNILRYTFLGLTILCLAIGASNLVAIIAPYSTYGRIVQSLLEPIWQWGNNLLADWASNHDNYTFYRYDTYSVSNIILTNSIITLLLIGILAWRNGRTWCNTICPVGTFLGFISRHSILKPVIDTSKCNSCGLCSRNCKASCIDAPNHRIDYSRCVTCMDCIDTCNKGAISYTTQLNIKQTKHDNSRRTFMTIAGVTAIAGVAKAIDKEIIHENDNISEGAPLLPPGAISQKHFDSHCTACQLCVSTCPNAVLHPSTSIERLMQPQISYSAGFCRSECTRCSEVCPTGAISLIDKIKKSSIQTGIATVDFKTCLSASGSSSCGNCARHCPSDAIIMVEQTTPKGNSIKIPSVDTSRCTGCGACEYHCPTSPLKAIKISPLRVHRSI